MKYKVYVDGQEGTTGLEINARLKDRSDLEILRIDPAKRKCINERGRFLNAADIVFLCLPDDAARESVSLLTNPNTRVIDASTAHRTADDWAYGLPELSREHRDRIRAASRVSNPGCFATGFNLLVYPLVKEGILPADYPVTCHSVTGYSGGGNRLIEIYEDEEKSKNFSGPCFYALGLEHKHLPEMKKHSGLSAEPIFTPIIGKFYRGMTVAVPLFADKIGKTASDISAFYGEYFKGERFVRVSRLNMHEDLELGYLNPEGCNHTNDIEVSVFGNNERILVTARLDNLGKGASGAAVQNMDIMLGI